MQNYTATKSILYSVSFSISLINFILKSFIKIVSGYEAHHTATEKLTSTTTKMWIVQFTSTALILLLINADWRAVISLPSNFPILVGKYKDFSVDWYSAVGATICLTCFTNTIMPLSNLVWWWITECKRCKDRGCISCNEKKTRKVLQSDYEKLYTGPQMTLADRYSTMIATIFIILLYSLSMPFLYFAGLLIFISMYWSDKILFFRYQCTPPKYTTELARRTYFLLEWAVILHFLFGLYMISNP